MPRVILKKVELEPASGVMDAWIRNLRLSLVTSQIGAVKGVIQPLAQGVYYDREALIDEHAVWDLAEAHEVKTNNDGQLVPGQSVGEDGKIRKRRMEELVINGRKLGDEVVMKDQQAYARAQRAMNNEELTVDVPFLFNDKFIAMSEKALQKVPEGQMAPSVDFGALQCLWEGRARLAPDE